MLRDVGNVPSKNRSTRASSDIVSDEDLAQAYRSKGMSVSPERDTRYSCVKISRKAS